MSGNFSLDISKIVEKAKGRIDTVVVKVTADIFHDVIMASPVGNPKNWEGFVEARASANTYHWLEKAGFYQEGYVGGRFKGNWAASAGSYKTEIYDVVDKNGGATVAAAIAVAEKAKSGGVVYLVNNLPYSQRLEYGYSKQAPAGMVRVAITNYQSYVNNAVSNIN